MPVTSPHAHADAERLWRRLLDQSLVPPHLREGLALYFAAGVPTGGFLRAILENDVAGALRLAGPTSRRAIVDIIEWLVQYAPSAAWGSRESVNLWIAGIGAQEAPRRGCF